MTDAYYQTVFENIYIKKLISNKNVCPPDWGETDCIYSYHKFYYFLGGSGKLIIGGDTFFPKPEQLYLIPANVRHSYSHDPADPVYKYWCHFDLSFRETISLRYNRDTLFVSLPKERVAPPFDSLVHAGAAPGIGSILEEKAALLTILSLFMEKSDLSLLLPIQKDDFANTLTSYMNSRLSAQVTLEELAGVAHLHPNYFIKVFRKYFNIPPLEYMNILRLDHAAWLLASEPDSTIDEVAEECGFHDYRYFGRSFKKRYGLTPSAYRKTGLPKG